jgi:hypothetical protein
VASLARHGSLVLIGSSPPIACKFTPLSIAFLRHSLLAYQIATRRPDPAAATGLPSPDTQPGHESSALLQPAKSLGVCTTLIALCLGARVDVEQERGPCRPR